MKTVYLPLVLLGSSLLTGCHSIRENCCAPGSSGNNPAPAHPRTYSSLDPQTEAGPTIPTGMLRFQEADLSQVLAVYQEISGRTLIQSPQVPAALKVTVENRTPLSRTEALQLLDTVLAAHQVVMIPLGSQYVKAVPAASAATEAGPVFDGPWRQLPESSSFVIYITKLGRLRAEDAISIVTPFARLPNSLIGTRGSDILFLRDYSANVRRMMEAIERVERAMPPPAKQP